MERHILEAIECLTAQINSEFDEDIEKVKEYKVVRVLPDLQISGFVSGWLMAKGIMVTSDTDLTKERVLKLLSEQPHLYME